VPDVPAEVTVLHPENDELGTVAVATFERVVRARAFLDDCWQDDVVQEALCAWAKQQLDDDDDLAALVEVLEAREVVDDS